MRAPALFAWAAATFAAPAGADATQVSTLVFLCDQARVLSLVQPKTVRPKQPVDLTFGAETKRMQRAAADGLPLAANCSLFPSTGKVPRPDKP